MAITGFLPPTNQHQEKKNKKKKKKKKSQTKEISSWEQLKNILSCKSTAPTGQQVHDPSKPTTKPMTSYCGSSLCAIRDVVHGNTRVVHRADTDHCSGCSSSPGSSWRHETVPLAVHLGSGSRGGMQLRSLSGCYEAHAVSIESGSRWVGGFLDLVLEKILKRWIFHLRPYVLKNMTGGIQGQERCVHVRSVVRCLLSLKVWNSIKLPSMQVYITCVFCFFSMSVIFKVWSLCMSIVFMCLCACDIV